MYGYELVQLKGQEELRVVTKFGQMNKCSICRETRLFEVCNAIGYCISLGNF